MKDGSKQILYELAESKKTVWELLERNDTPLKDFMRNLNELIDEGVVSADQDGLQLTDKGRRLIDSRILKLQSEVCDKCMGKRVIFNGEFNDILAEYRRLVKDRPEPALDFFQGYMREYDVISRVAFMHHYGDLYDKSFVLIGDDDLLSIALSLTELPSRILVLDIDERLGRFIEKINREYGFEIEFRRYNVADPLPEEYIGSFDVFSSEPLESISGLQAFIVRGVSCLREGGSGYFGLTILEASYRKWIRIEKLLVDMNCVITDIIKGFSRYPTKYETVDYEGFVKKLKMPVSDNPGIDWYKSALFRFEVLGKPKLIIDPRERLKIESVDPEEDVTHPLL